MCFSLLFLDLKKLIFTLSDDIQNQKNQKKKDFPRTFFFFFFFFLVLRKIQAKGL